MSFKDSHLKSSDLTDFNKVINDKVGMVTFRNFLKSIYAEENLRFWCDVVAFKKETTAEQYEFLLFFLFSLSLFPLFLDVFAGINFGHTGNYMKQEKFMSCIFTIRLHIL